MRKLIIIGLAGLMAGFVSCSKNEDGNVISREFPVEALNLITNLSDGTSVLSKGTYNMNTKITDSGQDGSIEIKDLVINNTAQSMTVPMQPYLSSGYDLYFKDVKGGGTMDLSNGTFLITPYFYYPTMNTVLPFEIPGMPTVTKIQSTYRPKYNYAMVATYDVGASYNVKTFQDVTFFTGKTTTSYTNKNGAPEIFNSETIVYELDIDIEKKTADVILYNAKFAAAMPMELAKITVEGLALNCENGVIKAIGENIVPNWYEGGNETPLPMYIFKKIVFTTTSEDLTKAQISYDVADNYSGTFTGTYVYTDYIDK